MDSFIRKSYRGGVVDVYKPYLENGYYYDVNSLYPYIMSISDMPVGPGVYKKLEINDSFSIDNFFGFVSVKVKTPKSLYIPFLTTNHKIYGLISPLGEWTDTYFSEEIKYALTLGYEFKYYACYKFDKKNIFSDYVITLYNERLKNKDKPELNGILKLLLNSLYGRFGMANSVYKNIFLKNTRKDKELLRKINLLYDAEIISTFKNLRKKDINTLTLLRYNEMPNFDNIFNLYKRGLLSEKDYKNILNEAKNKANDLNVSVHIASAITAYARIYMHKIKKEYQDSLYYSDTDSLIVDKEIDRELVSLDKIGLFKLENQVKRGIFISPKLYYLELENSVVKKSKGLDAALLSYKDFLCLYKEKPIQVKVSNNFIRDLKTYTINTSEQEIEVTGYLVKREKIFDQNGKWIETKPLLIDS
jgi:hypothetical protein